MTLFDLQNGDLFRYDREIYQLQEINGDTAWAPRVAQMVSDQWHPAGPLLSSNFNPYAEVEPGQLTLSWVKRR